MKVICRAGGSRGQALILVTAVMLVLFTAGMASLALGESQKKTVFYQAARVQAYYNAESGLERVVARLKKDPEWAGEVPEFGEKFYESEKVTVTIENQGGGKLCIESTGYHGSCRKTLVAVIYKGPPVEVLSWKEKYPVFPD